MATLFRQMLQPGLEGCLRFDLFKSVGTAATVGAATRLTLPKVGSHTAAYRVAVLYKVSGKQVPIDSDFLFLAQRRTVFFVSVVAPGIDSKRSFPRSSSGSPATSSRTPGPERGRPQGRLSFAQAGPQPRLCRRPRSRRKWLRAGLPASPAPRSSRLAPRRSGSLN